MPAGVDREFIVQATLILGPLDREQKSALLRRAADALGTYEGVGFVGEDPVSEAFMRGGPPGPDMTVMLRHPKLDELSNEENGWINLSVMDDGPGEPAQLFLSVDVGRDEEQVDLEWSVGLKLVDRLVSALEPDAGFMNGKLVDDEHYRSMPSAKDYSRSGPPAVLTPWTHIGGDRLGGKVRGWFEALPVARIRPAANGLTIRVVDRLGDSPESDLAEVLNDSPVGPIRYLPPQLSEG